MYAFQLNSLPHVLRLRYNAQGKCWLWAENNVRNIAEQGNEGLRNESENESRQAKSTRAGR